MAWTAKLKSKNVSNGMASIVITFLDESTNREFDKSYQIGSPGNDFVTSQACQEIRNLEALDAYVNGLVIGPIDTSEKPLHPDTQAANEFFSKLSKLNNLKASVSKGLIASDDQELADLIVEVKDLQKAHPEYMNDIRWK